MPLTGPDGGARPASLQANCHASCDSMSSSAAMTKTYGGRRSRRAQQRRGQVCCLGASRKIGPVEDGRKTGQEIGGPAPDADRGRLVLVADKLLGHGDGEVDHWIDGHDGTDAALQAREERASSNSGETGRPSNP